MKGYMGKFFVNLTTGHIEERIIPDQCEMLSGVGLRSYVLYNEIPAELIL